MTYRHARHSSLLCSSHRPRLLALCVTLLALLLAGCGAAVEAEQDTQSLGGETPEATAREFFNSFNQAMQDPQIGDEEVQRGWVERLASYFAPSERVDQRIVLGEMLESFAADLAELEDDHVFTVEVEYSTIQVTRHTGTQARVRLQDGLLRLRRVRIADDGYRSVLSEQQIPLHEALGQSTSEFPVLQVNGRWYLTERQFDE